MTSTIGNFEIVGRIARGGMGEVYRARHRTEGYPAALKVVMSDFSANARYVDAFLREVQASASLDHPCIVAVYDYGEIAPHEQGHGEEFRTGSPWLAMEYATAGTLESLRSAPSWSVVRRVLLEILDALAHAHARGLVHRDIKPANVLVTERDGMLALLLADFGISHIVDPDRRLPERTENIQAPSAGTPAYMAPEQFRGLWRDLGPWTDLYALGCLAWEFVTGQTPFSAPSPVALAMEHLSTDLPDFTPRIAVPDGLELWLRRLLRKDWRERYVRAADAAWALMQLPPLRDTPHEPDDSLVLADVALREMADAAAPTLSALELPPAPTLRLPSMQLSAVRVSDSGDLKSHATDDSIPPISRDWRRSHRDRRARRAGIGLFGLREIELVDREEHRDLLWSALCEASGGSARAVLIEAESGRGKSKLLRWVAQTAHELGAATVLHCGHAPIAGLADGLPKMLARHLVCGGLDREALFERIQEVLARHGERDDGARAAALTQLIAPAPDDEDDDVPVVRFGSPAERYSTVEQYLRDLARERPVLVTIDDVQWGQDALAFASYLLNAADRHPFPIVLVLALRPEELAARPLEARRIDELGDNPACERTTLGMLSTCDHLALVNQLLGLEDSLARQLVEASRGDPMFSVCVVGDWVQRGALVPGSNGYEFACHTDFELPATVIEACLAQLARVCAQLALPGRAMEALEVAAALGDHVEENEWSEICSRRDVRIPRGLVKRLTELGLARPDDSGFEFVHGVYMSALEQSARQSGRWRAIHADCAAVVERAAQNGTCMAERRARHFLAAERIDQGLSYLARAADLRMATSAYEEAIALTELYLQTVENYGLDPEPATTVKVRAIHASAHRFNGDGDTAKRLAEELLAFAKENDHLAARAEGLRVLAGVQHTHGDPVVGLDAYTESEECFEKLGDIRGMARCAHGRGWMNLNLGCFAEARQDFQRGAKLASQAGAPDEVAWNLQGQAEAAILMEDLHSAVESAAEALRQFRELGSRSGIGMALTSLGSAHRDLTEVDRAREEYSAALRQLTEFDSPLVGFTLFHMLLLEVSHGTEQTTTAILHRIAEQPQHQMPRAFYMARELARLHVAGLTDADLEPHLDDLASVNEEFRNVRHSAVPALARAVRRTLEQRRPALLARYDKIVAGI